MRTLLLVVITFGSVCVSASPEVAPPPRPAPLRAATLDQGTFEWPNATPRKAACLFLVGVDCPIANAYAPEIARIVGEYRKVEVEFAIVYPVRDVSTNEAKKHTKDYGFNCPAILDSELQVARRIGATATPEAVVLSRSGEVVYRGRIDDRYPKPGGKRRENPSTRDLRDALDAVLADQAPTKPWPAAVGCDIDFDE